MTIQNGRFNEQVAEAILDAMMADAKEYFGEDLNESDEAIIRLFYRPIAERLAEAQEDLGLVLDSAQIEFASDQALDYLTALIGVTREPATKATGEVKFSRDSAASEDYIIPSGTQVQTDSSSPTAYETTASATLASGTTSVTAPVESLNAGVEANAGANTVVVMPDPPSGIQSVTNPADIIGGSDEEPDDELRERAQDELGQGSRASAPALINAMKQQADVKSVSIFINDSGTDNTGTGGLPDHSFELVVEGGNSQDIGQAILDTKAVGDTSYGGANGSPVTVTAGLPNGQTHDIEFSRPEVVQVYIDIDMDVTDEYAGNDDVRDSIINYLGGLLSTGGDDPGELKTGDDVVYGEIEYQIRDIEGVYDINVLEIGTSANPTGTSNLTITDSQVATGDATDGSISINTTTVTPS